MEREKEKLREKEERERREREKREKEERTHIRTRDNRENFRAVLRFSQ